jgi:hypothetical protein
VRRLRQRACSLRTLLGTWVAEDTDVKRPCHGWQRCGGAPHSSPAPPPASTS